MSDLGTPHLCARCINGGARSRSRLKTPAPQKITRVPPFRPGDWVKLRQFPAGDPSADQSGKVRQVKALTCSITEPNQKNGLWRVHFTDGRCVEWHSVERMATEAERVKAGRR